MSSDTGSRNDPAVSSVVGEMIMVALVLLLIAIFSSSISSFLPVERYPSVTVMVTNDTLGNVTFWHKGGDWIRISDLKARVENSTGTVVVPGPSTAGKLVVFPDKATFDLGSNITVYAGPIRGGESVRLVTSRAVLFTGRLGAGSG
jgi:FlaG/FlaF family flagellin (archaellin)